ncbi:hypothetical protein PV327_001023 [Microctonus hyperodae]|uniref:Odorant receptor n=1 Tax=Microctonus hyperodae TaxID=165561 RepID=A0AA39G7U1_MICHY|nr:hypothetical protein PV327_001023 [Microctonus hyperodae]
MESVRFERMVRPIELVNRLISIWPLEGNKYPIESRIRRFHRVLMFVLVSILSIAVSFDVMHHWGSMHEVTECALIASAFYLSTLRLAVYTIHEEELKYVVHTMKTDWFESCKEDIAMLKKKCMFGFQLGKHFIVTVVVALTVFILAPALQIIFGGTDERVLPFRGYFFRNQINSPYYEYLYAFEIIAGLLGGSTISAATSLNLIITMHAAAKFSIVCEKLKSLKSDDINIKDHFANCVRLHQDAILFADRAENVINILALGQFVISTGLLCFAGFQLTSLCQSLQLKLKNPMKLLSLPPTAVTAQQH